MLDKNDGTFVSGQPSQKVTFGAEPSQAFEVALSWVPIGHVHEEIEGL